MRLMTHVREAFDGGFEVRVTVPRNLRSIVGRANLTKRLGRVSRSEANHRAAPVIARFLAELEAAGVGSEGVSRYVSRVEQAASSAPENSPNHRQDHRVVSLQSLFEGYVQERKPSPSTVKRWRPVFASLCEYVGHGDGGRITADDIVEWKQALLSRGISNRTVREVYLAGVKVTFNWAVENRKLQINPAKEITVRVGKSVRTRERGFTAEEARVILRASKGPEHSRISDEHARARRWVPWLCAYSGARVGEIAQLRGCDFFQQDGHWVMRITPAAGSTKTGESRLVPLHPHLLEQGLIKLVTQTGLGPLFYDPGRARGGRSEHPHYKKVGERLAAWVRGMGVDDPDVQPNHAWRHLFKTLARRAGVVPEIRDVLQGHAPRSAGENYGDWPVDILAAAIAQIPRFDM